MPPSREDIDRELANYLGLKRKEREDGNTNAKIRELIEKFGTALHSHIEENKQEFRQINETLSSHNARLTTLEAQGALKPINTGRTSIIPPAPTDTGNFKVPPVQWQQITAAFDELQAQKRTDEAVNMRLSKANERLERRVKFILIVAGGIITIMGAIVAVVSWGVNHIH